MPVGQGSVPAFPQESNIDALGHTLSASIKSVEDAVGGMQGNSGLNSMLGRVEGAVADLAIQEKESRASPAPQGALLANTTLRDDAVTGRRCGPRRATVRAH